MRSKSGAANGERIAVARGRAGQRRCGAEDDFGGGGFAGPAIELVKTFAGDSEIRAVDDAVVRDVDAAQGEIATPDAGDIEEAEFGACGAVEDGDLEAAVAADDVDVAVDGVDGNAAFGVGGRA